MILWAFVLITNLLLQMGACWQYSPFVGAKAFNTSACRSFWFQGVYYHLNVKNDDGDISHQPDG